MSAVLPDGKEDSFFVIAGTDQASLTTFDSELVRINAFGPEIQHMFPPFNAEAFRQVTLKLKCTVPVSVLVRRRLVCHRVAALGGPSTAEQLEDRSLLHSIAYSQEARERELWSQSDPVVAAYYELVRPPAQPAAE